MQGLSIAVLGPLVVRWHGVDVPVARGREATLLEWVVLHRDRGVSVDATVAALWPATDRAAARERLRTDLSRLRRRFAGTSASVVRSARDRLHVDVDSLWLDADAFEADRQRAMDALAAGRRASAGRYLEEALRRWRGDAWSWVLDTVDGLATAVRLNELRADAEDVRSALRMATGQHAEAVADLLARCERDPVRERTWRLLMAALASTGRRGEALRAYQRCRRALAEVGAAPSPATVALEQTVLGGQPLDPVRLLDEECPVGPASRPKVLVERAMPTPGGHPPRRRAMDRTAATPLQVVRDRWSSVGTGAQWCEVVVAEDDETAVALAVAEAVDLDGGYLLEVDAARVAEPVAALAAALVEVAGPSAAAAAAGLRSWPELGATPASQLGGVDDHPAARARLAALVQLVDVLVSLAAAGPVCLLLRHADHGDGTLAAIGRFVVDHVDPAAVLVVVTCTATAARAHPDGSSRPTMR